MAMKKLPLPAGRNTYKPGGGVNFGVFLIGAVITFAVAGLLGASLAFHSTVGFRLVAIAPLIAAVVAAVFIYQTVRISHCRNPILAGVFGFIVGAVVGFGEYQAEMVLFAGPAAIGRLDEMPAWINEKMNTQVIRKVAALDGNRGNGPGTVGIIFN